MQRSRTASSLGPTPGHRYRMSSFCNANSSPTTVARPAHLRARIAVPLTPPTDWARASSVTCSCRHCSELNRFLADPTRATWTYSAIQAERSHLESSIRHYRCDLDFTTLRRGSPHSLVCIKSQASYERRALQRKDDLEVLAQIG
jgi:hypothetical protein